MSAYRNNDGAVAFTLTPRLSRDKLQEAFNAVRQVEGVVSAVSFPGLGRNKGIAVLQEVVKMDRLLNAIRAIPNVTSVDVSATQHLHLDELKGQFNKYAALCNDVAAEILDPERLKDFRKYFGDGPQEFANDEEMMLFFMHYDPMATVMKELGSQPQDKEYQDAILRYQSHSRRQEWHERYMNL